MCPLHRSHLQLLNFFALRIVIGIAPITVLRNMIVLFTNLANVFILIIALERTPGVVVVVVLLVVVARTLVVAASTIAFLLVAAATVTSSAFPTVIIVIKL